MKIDIKGVIVPNDDKWVYDWLEYQAVCPRDVLTGLEQANGEPVDVYINSPGGAVFAGSEMYAALREYAGQVRTHVVGEACSAATLPMCAGICDIAPTAMVMVHNVSGASQGDYHAMDKTSQVLQKANQAVAAAYMDKTGKGQAEVLQMMERETWLTAQEAVDLGLADKIAEQHVRLTASAGVLLPQEVLDKIRNTVKRPLENEAGFFMRKARAQLNILKIGGIRA